MATADQLASEYIDISLHVLWHTIDGMPETAESWSTYDEEAQYDFVLEWWNDLSKFSRLNEAAEQGALTDEQHHRYERLVRRYEEVLPLIEQLQLETIPVPNLTARR